MIAPGTQLGSYRIEELIGKGGMGQVYRAVDTRLDRVVAIKVLPQHLSSNPQLRERFDREARAISSLAHPRICTLFDVGRQDGIDFLVMEYLEGESLADRLTRGPLPLDQVIRYGSEIAEALANAHQQHIVHRDLKPGNVMITRSGAKLLDFGLAKSAVTVLSPDAPTEQQQPLTAEGTLLGTFQYMAPEQVEGREADSRTDIFALGALLYEMVTGKRAFEGKSRASLIASILDRHPPSIASTQSAAPAALDRLIRACMAKDPEDRVQSARDIAMQLRWIVDEEHEESSRKPARRLWPLAIVAGVVILIAGATFLARQKTPPARAALHLSLLPPPGYDILHASVSPQGRIAFVAEKEKERFLFVRDLEDPRPRQLKLFLGKGYPFWSPDGQWIAFFDATKLLRISAAGGTPEVISDSSYGFGGAWGPDGTIVFTPGFYQPLFVIPPGGGKSRPLTKLDAARHEAVHAWPLFLPDNRGILFLAVSLPSEMSRIVHVPVRGGAPKDVLAADALVGYSDPFLLYVRHGDLYAVRFDVEKLQIAGEPKRVVEQVAYNAGDSSAFSSVTAGGILLYPPRIAEKRRLVWYDRSGKALSVAVEEDDISDLSLSPDGKRLLVSKFMHQVGSSGVYSIDLERGTRTLLTPPPRFGFNPVWLLDGERFAFTSSRRTPDYDIFLQLDDPQAEPVALWEGRSDTKDSLGVTPDGKYLVVREFTQPRFFDIWLVPLSGNEPRRALLNTTANESSASVSPDGQWIAYGSNSSGTEELYVRALAGGRSIRVSTGEGFQPRWSRDGKEIFFVTPDRTLMSARFEPGERPTAAVPQALFTFKPGARFAWELSPDGNQFLVNELADAATAGRPYNVMIGWKERLEQ